VVGDTAIDALDRLPLATLTQSYFTNQDVKLIRYIVQRMCYQYPIVVQDSKKGYQQLVAYPTAGVPEVLGEYPTAEVKNFMQHINQKIINDNLNPLIKLAKL
jgi:hypothetical protein